MKRLLALALPLLLAFGQYGYALTLPFFTDDANHYRFLQSVNGILPLWTGQTWSAYYRPVVYSLWKGMVALQGRYDPVWQHWVNVTLFGVSGVLLSLLMMRLLPPFRGRLAAACVAGCAFVLVPFHYQAVNLVGSLTHLAVTVSVLLALVSGLHYLRNGSRGALILGALAALLACFSHETGFLVTPFLVGAGLLVGGSRRPRRLLLVSILPALISLIYVGLWLTLPRVGTEGGLRLSSSPLDNAGVLVQTFVYPLAALIRPLVVGRGSSLLMLGLFGVVLLIGIGLIVGFGRRFLPLALAGVVWYLVVIAPSVLVLQPDYVWSSPRLTVLASVGAVIFWVAGGAAVLTSRRRGARLVQAIGLMVLVGVLALNLSFLNGRRVEYLTMRDYTADLTEVMLMAHADTQGALLINAPNYLEVLASERTFPVQAQFTSFMTPEVDYRDYLEVNSGQRFSALIEPIGVGRILQYVGGQYVTTLPLVDGDDLLRQLRQPRPIVVTQFEGERFFPVWAGTPATVAGVEPLAQFGEVLTVGLAEPLQLSDQQLQVVLQWQSVQASSAKLFIHVLYNGEIVAQSDGYVWGNLYPFHDWRAGEQQIDRRVISVPAQLHLSDLTVQVGVYDENTGQRFVAVQSQTGTRFRDDTVPLS